jgi:type II secretory pathway pseudopilin PulG
MEVVVAVVIVGMTAIATLSAFATELRTADTSRAALEAASLGESRLAMLELVPAEDLIALPDSNKAGKFDPPFEQYEWTGAVTPVTNEPDLFEATVRVTWPNGGYAISTRMYRPAKAVRTQ